MTRVAADASTAETRVRPYDFQRQETLERGRLRRLNPILEVLAHRIGGALTAMMRMPVRVEAGPTDQVRWEEYASSLPEPTFLTSAMVTPLGGRVVLHLPVALCMAAVEVRLGGSGTTQVDDRPLTEIEQLLVGEVANAALDEIPAAFAPVLPLGLGATTSVASSMFLQVAKPSEYCALITLAFSIGDGGPMPASLCVPFTVLLPLVDAVERLEDVDEPAANEHMVAEVRARLLECTVEPAVCFPDVPLASDEILGLAPGDVIPLHRDQGLPLLLSVAGVPYCEVVPMVRGKRLACIVVESGHEAPQAAVPLALGDHPSTEGDHPSTEEEQ